MCRESHVFVATGPQDLFEKQGLYSALLAGKCDT